MRDAMLQGTLAFGVLAITLLGLGGLAFGDKTVLLFTIIAAMLGYFSQLAGALYEGSAAHFQPIAALLWANWFGWIASCCAAITAFIILFSGA